MCRSERTIHLEDAAIVITLLILTRHANADVADNDQMDSACQTLQEGLQRAVGTSAEACRYVAEYKVPRHRSDVVLFDVPGR